MHIQHDPQEMLNGMTTRSPGWTCVDRVPDLLDDAHRLVAEDVVGCMYGASTSYRCRSEPQIAVEVTRMTTSVGSSIFGSGISLTCTSRLPCQVTALMALSSPR